MTLRNIIQSLKFFDTFSIEEITLLQSFIELREYEKGELIVDQSVINTNLYFLLNGSIGVYVNKELVSSESNYGDVYGEMSLAGGRSSYAKIISHDQSSFLIFNFLAVHEMADDRRDHIEKLIYKSFSIVLANRLNKANLTIRKLKSAA